MSKTTTNADWEFFLKRGDKLYRAAAELNKKPAEAFVGFHRDMQNSWDERFEKKRDKVGREQTIKKRVVIDRWPKGTYRIVDAKCRGKYYPEFAQLPVPDFAGKNPTGKVQEPELVEVSEEVAS